MNTLEQKTTALAFDQLPRESARAYAAFKTYLDMGADRSLVKVAQQIGKKVGPLQKWCSKYDWTARCAAHTAHFAMVERKAQEKQIVLASAEWKKRETRLKETEWAMHERAIAAAQRGLNAFMEKEKVYANLSDIARMLEIASKLGRLATGIGTEPNRTAGNGPVVRVEVNVALEKIYGQPLPCEVATPAVIDIEEVKKI